MTLAPGDQLGPYEVVSFLGAGGMGEVYRARDRRLAREVAVKVLPARDRQDAERARRLQQEARAAGALNHPNVVAVLDVGEWDGAPYVVSELLEGESLHSRLHDGPLPLRRALDLAVQIARGLAAAHEKGIVHRDLKPENVFVTGDGRVKLLDFGLARADPMEPLLAQQTAPLGPATAPGTILGTVGYMAPEQVRGGSVDARADIFAFGAILHEMLGGRRTFERATSVETLGAILNEEPPSLEALNGEVPPALAKVVETCLEKRPDERFRSARDLGLALSALSGTTSSTRPLGPPPAPVPAPRRSRAPALGALVLLALAGAWLAGRAAAEREEPRFQSVTFRRGSVHWARLTADAQTIAYSASWGGEPITLFTARAGSAESTPLENLRAHPLSVSVKDELAVLLLQPGQVGRGTLARLPLAGGAPRKLLDDVEWADWAPDGSELAAVRLDKAHHRLEFPPGRLRLETPGWISHPRFSPDGKQIAYLEHPVAGDNRGSVELLDLESGERRTLSGPWKAAWGLAWGPGREVWFTSSDSAAPRSLWAVDLRGRRRLISGVPLRMTLHDVSRDGRRVLISSDGLRRSTFGRAPGESAERDLSWMDYSNAKDLSEDGRTLLFSEDGDAGGANSAVYVRPTDGGPAVRLGEGKATALSPDGRWALSILVDRDPHQLVALPTGTGQPRELPRGRLATYTWASWFPDGKRLVLAAAEPGRRPELWIQDFEGGGLPRSLGGELVSATFGGLAVSPDGQTVAAKAVDQRVLLVPVAGGPARALAGLPPSAQPVRWSADGRRLFLLEVRELPAPLFSVDVATGQQQPLRTLLPGDPAGVLGVNRVRTTADASAYVYTFSRITSELFLVEGLR